MYSINNHYELLSKFESLKEFNNEFEQAMVNVKDKFTKSEYIALNRLRKYMAHVVGVAYAKIATMVAATHYNGDIGISRSTFERMLRKAKRLNLITVINQVDKRNRKKHSVYVFNRLDEMAAAPVGVTCDTAEVVSESNAIDVSKLATIDVSIKSINLIKTTVNKDINTYTADNVTSVNNENKPSLYRQVITLIKERKLSVSISEVMKIVYGSIKKAAANNEYLSYEQASLYALECVLSVFNSSKVVNVLGCLSMALKRKFEALGTSTSGMVMRSKEVIPDWMDEYRQEQAVSDVNSRTESEQPTAEEIAEALARLNAALGA